jgi:hypothetical protein
MWWPVLIAPLVMLSCVDMAPLLIEPVDMLSDDMAPVLMEPVDMLSCDDMAPVFICPLLSDCARVAPASARVATIAAPAAVMVVLMVKVLLKVRSSIDLAHPSGGIGGPALSRQ